MPAKFGGVCFSLPGCRVLCQGLAREDVSPEHNKHLLALQKCSGLLGEMGCLRLAGSQPGSCRLTAHHCHRLCEPCHSRAQVGIGIMTSTQGIPEWVGNLAGLTWGTAGHVAGALQTLAPCHTGWVGDRHQGPSTAITLHWLPEPLWDHPTGPGDLFHTHTSLPPLILGAKSAWAQQTPQKAAQDSGSTWGPWVMTLCHPTLQHTHCGPGWL